MMHFKYFLDAWLYCVDNMLDWKTEIYKDGPLWTVGDKHD
jgi:hypothetical protein